MNFHLIFIIVLLIGMLTTLIGVAITNDYTWLFISLLFGAGVCIVVNCYTRRNK